MGSLSALAQEEPLARYLQLQEHSSAGASANVDDESVMAHLSNET